eukprot:TRINITY_DN67150_c0_g2_i3.p1 TRINITY_DN67150_c0_g2~~TRINITY_DN67150_c0_g2_i3.p1  ORF type:complete len:360 (+),score=52.73 TRINITY_DN67150_c0_g2_i3:254-1333(+)
MSSSDSESGQSLTTLSVHDIEPQLLDDSPTHSTPLQKGGGRGKNRKSRKQKLSPLTDAQKEEMLDFLKDNPFLYNKAHPAFKDSSKRKRAWKQMDERFVLEDGACWHWYRSVRTMLSRAKKMKSKSGSGGANLPAALQWVWDKLDFLQPFMSSLSQDTVGPQKRSAAMTLPETEADDHDHPGPIRKVPRPAALSDSRATSATKSAPAQAANCCGHLCSQLESMVHQYDSPMAYFWRLLDWRIGGLDSHQLFDLQTELWQVVNRHVHNSERPSRTTMSAPSAPAPAPAAQAPPSTMAPPQQPRPGPSTAPDDLDSFMQSLVSSPSPRISPRKQYRPARIPQRGASTSTSLVEELDFSEFH